MLKWKHKLLVFTTPIVISIIFSICCKQLCWMGTTVDISGFPTLEYADVVKTTLERYTGVGSIEAVEVRQKNAGARAYARVQFTTRSEVDLVLNLDSNKQLWYGTSYLKAWEKDIDLVQKPRQFTSEKEGVTLHFGCQVSKETLPVLCEMKRASVKFGFGLRKLYFDVPWSRTSYKLQLSYDNIWKVQLHCPRGVAARFLVIQLYGAPQIYQKISALVQHGCIPGPVLDASFFALLDPQRRDIESIEYVMEKLYFSKDCCYDPVRLITEEYQKNKRLRSPAISLDSGLVYVRRVQITPSKVYFCGPEVNVSNRVLRHYSDYIDNFLRVSFLDEELEKLYSIDLSPKVGRNGETRTGIYWRILSILRDGIKIGNKKFEFLAFSSSQLHDNSAWMFASTGRLNATEIRNWMGDFSSIKNVAKYAARLGQSFGSSKESFSVPRYEVEEIPDIEVVRAGTKYVFSDGIGKISAAFANRVSIKCGYDFIPSAFQVRYGRRPLGDDYSGIGSYKSRIVRGDVVVAKNPCLHPGDVRVLKAVSVPELHHMVDCVVFPQKGERHHPNECSGSDLDGDIYFVCWDPDLIPPQQFEPMDYTPAPALQLDHDVTIEEVEEYFANYIVNDSLGMIANAHIVFADREPIKAMATPCVELAKLFSIAVDFPKTGVPTEMPSNLRPKEYPDFMEKLDKTAYESQNVIGKLFREVKHIAPQDSPVTPFTKDVARQTYDADMEVPGFEDYTDEAFDFKTVYDNKLCNLMDYYGNKTEAELLTGSIMKISRSFDRRNDAEAVGLAVKSLRKEARNWFKNGRGDRDTEDDNVYAKASAWYHVTYHPNYWGRYDTTRDHFLSFSWCVHDKLIEIKKQKASVRRHVDYD
ncbi:hypothetical protein L1987_11458 [Smallanthus sonchifolius]|uniref:Uncharacterized protein n=1 Tax=Smallanthus sonchifolius TaxID=185202 RepID=A0ACB9JEG1_9ASTR|nr:hypothetical protein L1987_11458 [Smallanthus sonchifolius]